MVLLFPIAIDFKVYADIITLIFALSVCFLNFGMQHYNAVMLSKLNEPTQMIISKHCQFMKNSQNASCAAGWDIHPIFFEKSHFSVF